MAATTTLTPTPTSATAAESPKLLRKASSADVKASPSTPTQTSFGCQHIKGLLTNARDQAISGYTKAIKAITHEANLGGKIFKTANGTPTTTAQVTYLCLQCPTVTLARERHRKEHQFSVESSKGFILCHECRDFVYDPTFEEIRANLTGDSCKKRKSDDFLDSDRKLLATNSTSTPCAATGLRGFYNMGQTCFMSVILQSIIHNPFIRSWYLNEGHPRPDCDRDACVSCALDDIFNDFYAQEKHEGFGAVLMLQACWKHGHGLAGYSQQDAHEYFGFFLNSLHMANNDEDDEGVAAKKDPRDCDCVVHQTFGGLLKSTVTCTKCKTTTSTMDFFMDLSLDIKDPKVKVIRKKLTITNGTQTIREIQPMDLKECLDSFTGAETLSADSYRCKKCNGPQEARKKLSLSRLPPVIPIHLKRFAHSKTLSQSNKVDTRVRFPFTLDFGPYATSTSKKKTGEKQQHQANGGSSKSAQKDAEPQQAEQTDPVYELSSVVVHKGKIDNGHYVSYSKQGDEWFRFDDSMVVQVDEKEVLNAEAYMLFYVIREFA